MVYLNACLFADIRLEQEKQVKHPTVRSFLKPRRGGMKSAERIAAPYDGIRAREQFSHYHLGGDRRSASLSHIR